MICDVKLHYKFRFRGRTFPPTTTTDRNLVRLTYDFHFVGGVDLSGRVGHVAGVLPAVLWRQVLQTQRPPLLLAAALIRQRSAVLQPDDVGSRVPAGRALEPHRAAHRPSDDALPHLGRLGEAGAHCERAEGTRGVGVCVLGEGKRSAVEMKCERRSQEHLRKLEKGRQEKRNSGM